MQRWLISDTHFDHKNIITYESRPFKTLEDMNWALIENWNSVVRNNDLVYHAGDFAFAGAERTKFFVSQLKGKKILIKGSHDGHSNQWFREAGFDEVINYSIILDKFYILSHEPQYICGTMPYVNIHGHIHSKKIVMPGVDVEQYVNISVECINYTPINMSEIKKRFNK